MRIVSINFHKDRFNETLTNLTQCIDTNSSKIVMKNRNYEKHVIPSLFISSIYNLHMFLNKETFLYIFHN